MPIVMAARAIPVLEGLAKIILFLLKLARAIVARAASGALACT